MTYVGKEGREHDEDRDKIAAKLSHSALSSHSKLEVRRDILEEVVPHGEETGSPHGQKLFFTLLVHLSHDPRFPSEELDHADDIHHYGRRISRRSLNGTETHSQ